jgi:hypothetical protein
MTLITEIEKSTLKFIWKHKSPWIAKAILSKKSNAGSTTISNLKLYYRAIAIKTAWYWRKNRYEGQWNRMEDLDMNPRKYAHLIFDKGAKNIWWRTDSLFNKWYWEKWSSDCRKLKLGPRLSFCTRINTKQINDLNMSHATLQLVHKRAGTTLKTIGIGKDFLSPTTKRKDG